MEAHRAQAVLAAGVARLTATFDLRKAWSADGSKSPSAWLAYWLQHADPDGVERDVADDGAARFLRVSSTFRGNVEITGHVPAVAGAVLAEALGRIESELFRSDWTDAQALHAGPSLCDRPRPTPRRRRPDHPGQRQPRVCSPPPSQDRSPP